MNPKIKISQLPAKGSNLAAADLLEVAEFTGTGYISKSITGQEIIDAAVGNVDWGDIGGTLSDQTDLNTALSGKVPTTRTLTINGTTQDLSADRTFTISTGITIGTTAITSGTVGRVLFEGTGNVVQESANLFWDNTNGRLGVGGTPGAFTFDVNGTARVVGPTFAVGDWTNRSTSVYVRALTGGSENRGFFIGTGASNDGNVGSFTYQPTGNLLNIRSPYNSGTVALSFEGNTNSTQFHNTSGIVHSKIVSGTGNWLINTTTDAGFKLDVNGTARVVGQATIQTLTVGLGASARSNNTVLGLAAFSSNTTGNFNVAIGPSSLFSNTTGTGNISIGHFSAVGISTGTNNVAIGREALSNGNSSGNVAIGFQSCSALTGNNNVVIGLQSQSGNFNGSIVLGINAAATASNQFVVGSSTTNAGTVTSEVNASTQVWNVIINGVARKILLA